MESLKSGTYRLLRRSEGFFKTDMVYLAKGGFWLNTSYGVSVVVLFGLTILMANVLPKDVYGNYKYILSIAGILGGLSLAGMPTAIVQSVARGYEGILRKGFAANLKFTYIFLSGSALVVSGYYFWQENRFLGASMLIVALCYPIMTGSSFGPTYLNGKKDFTRYALFQFFRNVIPALALAVAAISYQTHESVLLLIAVNIFSYTIAGYAIYLLILRITKPNNLVDETSFAYGKHLSAMGFFSNLTNRIDSMLVFHFLGAVPLATYSIAMAVPDQILALMKNLHFLALPKFSARNPEEVKKALFKKTTILFSSSLVAYAAYWFLIPFFFSIFFPQYGDAVFYARLIGLNFVFASLTSLMGTYLDSRAEVKIKYSMTVSVGVLKILLMLVLAPMFGITGIILGELITRIVLFATFVLLWKYI